MRSIRSLIRPRRSDPHGEERRDRQRGGGARYEHRREKQAARQDHELNRGQVFSDPERRVQKDLDIQEYTDREHDPMIPHTLVLKPGLVIHRVYNGYWFWGRPSVEDLRQDLRAVTREIRPDWDLSTPGLRQRWDAGDWSPFHGWNKRGDPKSAAR